MLLNRCLRPIWLSFFFGNSQEFLFICGILKFYSDIWVLVWIFVHFLCWHNLKACFLFQLWKILLDYFFVDGVSSIFQYLSSSRIPGCQILELPYGLFKSLNFSFMFHFVIFLLYSLRNVIFQSFFLNLIILLEIIFHLKIFLLFKLFCSLNYLYSGISVPQSLVFYNHLIQLIREGSSGNFPWVRIFFGITEFINYFKKLAFLWYWDFLSMNIVSLHLFRFSHKYYSSEYFISPFIIVNT